MVDSGATALFLNQEFITRHHVKTFPLKRPIGVFNIDGSANRAGQITHFARLALTVDGQERWTDLLVTNLGSEDLILGLPWLRKANPDIDWEKGRLSVKPQQSMTDEEEEEENIRMTETPEPVSSTIDQEEEESPIHRIRANRRTRRAWVRSGILQEQTEEVWCAAGFTYSQQLAEQTHKAKPLKTFEEMVPEPYRDFQKVFSEAASE